MATIYKCDKCENISSSSSFLTEVILPQVDDLPWDKKYDLCGSCIRQLHFALKPGTIVTFPAER